MRAIEINHVSKKYKDTLALDQVHFQFEHGKIYGLLGRNGAGKSTLLNIISNRIFASEGTILIDGLDSRDNEQVHELIFCMSEANLYPNLKVKELINWTDQFYDCFDMEKAITLCNQFGLDRNKKINALSTGYKSIFKLIVALSLQVPYVIFDEPVLGLDANHREMFYKLLLEDFEKSQRTIILATHLIEEVAGVIEDIVIIDHGKILLQDSVENLMSKGYSISGLQSDVDTYCQDKNVIGFDELGNMKIAYVLGELDERQLNERLHPSSINLQKLFVKLTENGGTF